MAITADCCCLDIVRNTFDSLGNSKKSLAHSMPVWLDCSAVKLFL